MPTLVVQMGHAGRTRGATGTAGEQEFTQRVGAACVRLLDGRGGWKVRLIQADTGTYTGDAFVAVHADGSTNITLGGASVGYQNQAGQAAAQAWKRAYEARGWPGGFHPDNYTTNLAQYYGVRSAVAAGNKAAIIVEAGYLTNPANRTWITSDAGVDRVALAIGDAFGIQLDHTPAIEQEEPMSVVFAHGDNRDPMPNSKYAWGDVVFKIEFAHPYPVVAVRTRIDTAQEPGYKAWIAARYPIITMKQADLDAIPMKSDMEKKFPVLGTTEFPSE